MCLSAQLHPRSLKRLYFMSRSSCDKELLSLEPPGSGFCSRRWVEQRGERLCEKQNYLRRSILELQPVQVESTFKVSLQPHPLCPLDLRPWRFSRVCCVLSQALEEPRSPPGPRPGEAILHVCLERVGQLELWLQEAQRSLRAAAGSSTMQRDSLEQRLLTCQVSSARQGTTQDLQGDRGVDVKSEVKPA